MTTQYRTVIAAGVAMAMVFAAKAAKIEYDDDATVNDALAMTEDTEISVASGKTVFYFGAISEAHKLTKSGTGTLVLAAANTFSGGIEIASGTLAVSNANALAANDIEIITSGTTGSAKLKFCVGGTFANKINVTGVGSTYANMLYAIDYWAKSLVTLQGKITADCNFAIMNSLIGGNSLTIDAEVSAPGKTIYVSAADNGCAVNFKQKVTCNCLDTSGGDYTKESGYGAKGAMRLYSTENDFNYILVRYLGVSLSASGVMPKKSYLQWSSNASIESNRGIFNVGSATFVHEFDHLDTRKNHTSDGARINGSATLILTPEQNASASCCFCESVKLVLNAAAPDVAHEFITRKHITTGSIVVSNGIFAVGSGCAFSNVTALAIDGGTLRVTSTDENAFQSVESLPIAANGTLIVGKGASPFQETMTLALESGATLNLSNNLTVASATVDGVAFPKGTWTGMAGINFKGDSSITVSEGPDPVYTWTGEGGDNLLTNSDNWRGPDWLHGTPASFTDGTARIVLRGGKTVEIASDVKVKELTIGEGGYVLDAASGATFTIAGKLAVEDDLTNATEYQFEGEEIEIEVAEGKTLTYSAAIAGALKVKKSGLGTLVMPDAKAYTGGTEIAAGTVEMRNKDSLGTGDITVDGSTEHVAQLKFRVPQSEAWITNAIVIEGSSSREYPAFNFATNTYLRGTITANGDLYMADTAYAQNAAAATQAYIKFSGEVTVSNGFRIASAPHCLIDFGAKMRTPILEGYYVGGGTAVNDGNAGAFRISWPNNNSIDRIIIDQTGIVCARSSCMTNTILEWTGEHLADEVGRFDLSGTGQSIFDIITPEIEKDGVGCVITNSASNFASITIQRAEVARECYVRIDGPINFNYNVLGGVKRPINFTFRNRRHLMSGNIGYNQSKLIIGEGAAFPLATSISNSNGSDFSVTSHETDVFENVTSISFGTSLMYLYTEEAIAALSRGHKASLSNASTGSALYLGGKTPLELKWFYSTRGWTGQRLAGAYSTVATTNSTADSFLTSGTLLVWCDTQSGTRTNWTQMVWSGASAASTDVNDFDNWQPLKKFATFQVPCGWVKFGAGGTSATLTNDVNWGGITFDAANGFTLGNGTDSDVTIGLYDNGIGTEKAEESYATERAFVVRPKLAFNTTAPIAVATNDTLTLEQPIFNGALTKSGEGTLVAGGEIPTNVVVTGGTLAFAEGATLPADNTMVLKLGADAKIRVGAGDVLKVKSVTTNGVAVSVGYFAEGFVTGGGKVRVWESTAPMTQETITWNNSGEDGLFSETGNWNPSEIEWAWANKYDAAFGAVGSAAVVDAAYNLHSLAFGVPSSNGFKLKHGSEDAALTVGDGITIADDEGVKGKVFEIGVPLNIAGTSARSISTPDGARLVLTNGIAANCNLTFTGKGTNYFGDMSVNGAVTVSSCGEELSGTIDSGTPGQVTGADKRLLFNFNNGYGVDSKLTLAGINCYKYFQLNGRTTDSKHLYVKAGTTNVIHGYFSKGTPSDHWYVDGVLELAGGVSVGWSSRQHGSGRLIISGKPLTTAGKNLTSRWIFNAGELVLNVASNAFARKLLPQINAATLRCGTNYVFAKSMEFVELNDAKAVMDIGHFNQRIGYIRCTSTEATLTGEYPARLEYGMGVNDAGKAKTNVNFKVEGGVSLVMDGYENGVMLLKGVKNSVGDLEAKSGILEFADGSSWLNGTNLVVREKGVIKFSGGDNVNGAIAALKLTSGGKVNIPSGVTVRVATAATNGVALAIGSYTASELGDFITGEGKLKVGTLGTYFIIK